MLAVLWCALLPGQDRLADEIRSAQSSGNYSGAAKLYRELINAGTDTPEIRSNYGMMLHLAGKNNEAMGQFQVALKRNPALNSANFFGGLTAFDLGEYKAALDYLKRAQALDPERPTPLLALGKTYVALREFQLANECYQKATRIDDSAVEGWYGLGVTYRSMAEQMLNHAARAGQVNNLATKAKAGKLLDSALGSLTHAIELDPDSARTHLLMAESLSDAGKLTDAVPEYQKAIRLDEKLDAAYLGLATEYWKQRQFDQARPYLEHVLLRSPEDAEANGMLADICEHDGNYGDAERYATAALRQNPDLIETHVVLARVYLAREQTKLAISELEKVLDADSDGSYHFLLYRAYKQAGEDDAAKAAMAKFRQIRNRNGT